MIVLVHLCMPEGEPMRAEWTDLCNLLREDNRMVVASMLRAGIPVADTVEELGLRYVPEWHRKDPRTGEPTIGMYSIRYMLERGTFSCGDACGYESAVLTEKYGIATECLGVDVGEGDMTGDYHGIFVTPTGAIDPVARFLGGGGGIAPQQNPRGTVAGRSCSIIDGRVQCDDTEDACCLDEEGRWYCPSVPLLHGRRERIGKIRRSRHGAWSKTASGATVPICVRGRR